MLWLTVAPAELDAVGRALAAHPDVACAAVTTGTTNLIAYVACADDDDLYERVLLPIGRIPGVGHIDLAPVARQVTRNGPVPRGAGRAG
jgi:DNA-binding Lrp family transcriptional regulator